MTQVFKKLLLKLKVCRLLNIVVFNLDRRILFKDKKYRVSQLVIFLHMANIQDGEQHATFDQIISRTKVRRNVIWEKLRYTIFWFKVSFQIPAT